MIRVGFVDSPPQEVKGATWFQFSDGILYLYGGQDKTDPSGPLAAFPQCSVLSVMKSNCCCQS